MTAPFCTSCPPPGTDLARCFEIPGRSNVLYVDRETRRHIRSLLDRLIALEEYGGFGSDLLDKAHLIELLVLLNIHSPSSVPSAPQALPSESRLIDDVISYINTHCEENLSLDRLADAFFLSKYHLAREFRRCGFGDYSNFFRSFRKEYGMTPRHFYETMNGEPDPGD